MRAMTLAERRVVPREREKHMGIIFLFVALDAWGER
jgi:hypothetical protein